MTSSLYIAPYTLFNWYVYLDWFKQRELDLPSQPKEMILVADEDTDDLVGGACVYPTEGPWVFIEHMSFKPDLPKSLILRGMYHGMQAARGLGAMIGKRPLIHSSHPSIDAMLARCGYTKSEMTCWYTDPVTKRSPQEIGENLGASGRDERTAEQDAIMPEEKNILS
ncbi:MAG: hypothetical protein JRD89_20760 [Deltaproteobacteria bacterium]|nr:hypothetical protein [Deltaproteobacteria bacterium]